MIFHLVFQMDVTNYLAIGIICFIIVLTFIGGILAFCSNCRNGTMICRLQCFGMPRFLAPTNLDLEDIVTE